MRAKDIAVKIFVVSFLLLAVFSQGYGQLKDAIEELNSANTSGYLQPFAEVFGSELNAGLYRTAHVSKVGLHLYVGITAMGTVIPDNKLTFQGTPPEPYPQDPVETATVFGKEGAVVDGPGGLKYVFQNGQIQGNFVPLAVPQIEVGSFLGTMVKLRYFAYDFGENIGKLELVGYGVQHSISQYLLLMPVDLSVGVFMHTFKVGDILTADLLSIGAQASKGLGLLTIYGAAALESTKLDVKYTYKGNGSSEDIAIKLESKNQFRFTVGGSLKLTALNINADYTLGTYQTVAVGVGFGL